MNIRQAPTVRLAVNPKDHGKSGANTVEHHVTVGGLGYPDVPLGPTLRLAHIDGAQGDCTLKGEKGVPQVTAADAPALLVSYYYLGPFLKQQRRYRYRDWVLDSGAFSAHNSGVSISLSEFTDTALRLLSTDPTLTEVFALDVIPKGSHPSDTAKAAEQSLKNCEEMWRQGVPAVPTFHRGEPEEHLYHMAKHYPKIALGGVAVLRGDAKLAWLEQCFARVWPKRVHGFGMAGEEIVFALPFHSVDATNWELAPCAFGSWQKFGAMSVRGSNQDLRSQVKHYLALEAKARVRWAKQMAQLEALPDKYPSPRPAPDVRLALGGGGREGRDSTLGPTVLISPLSSSSSSSEESAPAPRPKRTKLPPKRSSDELPELADKWANWKP
jgi:hypothetical protein